MHTISDVYFSLQSPEPFVTSAHVRSDKLGMQKKWKMFFFLIIILTLSLSYCSYSFSFSGPFTGQLEPLNSQIREKRLKMTPSFTQHLLLICFSF